MHSQGNQIASIGIPARFHQAARAAAVLVLVLGLAGFCGWVFNVAALTSIRPTFASMKFNTSVLFLCLGTALWMSQNDERQRSVATLSFLVAIIAALTLAEYGFGISVGIDQLIFRDTQTLVTPYPGRMAVATAVCFLLLSLALLLRVFRTMPALQNTCVFGCLAIAVLAVCGYLYDVGSLYSIKPFSSMALHTAIGFGAACLSYLFARPNEGIVSVAASDSSAGLLLRTLVPTSVGFSIILGGLIVAGEKAGLYETPFGVGLLVLVSLGCLTGVAMLTARSLHQMEREREQAAKALKTSEEKFSTAFRESPIAVTLIRARDQRYLDVNLTFERMTGWRRDEVIGRSALDLGICKEPAQKLENVQRVQNGGVIRDLEFQFYRKDGTQRVGLSSLELIEIENEPCVLSVTTDITERKQIEERLHESEEKLKGIVRSAIDVIITIDEEQRVVLFNAAAEKMFGCSEDESMGTAIDRFIPQRFRSEHKAHIRRFGESGISNRGMSQGRLWGVRTSGEEFPIDASISQVVVDGKKLFTAIIRDITERHQVEEAIRESEERFRLVANTAPVLIWMSGPDRRCTYFNQPWLEFTGRTLEAELGDGWAVGVHPDDASKCLDTYKNAFDRRESFQMEYRLRRHDGEYRWLLDIGVPRLGPGGSFAGYIGSCVDITERKAAEEALSDVGRRLIEAQEEERTWIARELHDDINQRLALAVIELQQCSYRPRDGAQIREQIGHVTQRLVELGKDVQALSHRLHSSKLEYLGLTMAAHSFCRELSEQQNVEIDFTHEGMSNDVPKEISLCLFRVLQEALQNAVKHSGVRHFTVKLEGGLEEIQLSISDRGAGFDQQHAISGPGLGLISMRERIQLVKGKLSITSQLGHGTTVRARVPFKL